jgi:hypothetical protein
MSLNNKIENNKIENNKIENNKIENNNIEEKIILELIHNEFNQKLEKFSSNINSLFTNNTFKLKFRNLLKKTKTINNLTRQVINRSNIYQNREDEPSDDYLDIEELVDKYPVYPPSIDINMNTCSIRFELFPNYDEDILTIDSKDEYKTVNYFLRLYITINFPEYNFEKHFKMKYFFTQSDMNKKKFFKDLKNFFNIRFKRCESCDNVSEWFLGRTCLSCQFSDTEIIDCSICKNDRDVVIRNIFKTECNHKFHMSCFRQYIKSTNSENEFWNCPNCRGNIEKGKFFKNHGYNCCHVHEADEIY